jgi:diguanylate cyclase (GGDEF)-like protein
MMTSRTLRPAGPPAPSYTRRVGRTAQALDGARKALADAEDRLEGNLRQQTAVVRLGRLALSGCDLCEIIENAAAVSADALGRRVGVSILPSVDSRELRAGSWTSAAASGRSVAIISLEEVLGELRVESSPAPTPDELAFLEATASVIADTIQRLRAEQVMRHQALHDPLTGLPNRTLLGDRLTHALQRSSRRGPVAVLFLDLDHFKLINDSRGHRAGDELLCTVATRLRLVLRPGDTVARFGGDEFCVVCDDVRDAVEGGALARREIARPFALESGEHFTSASVGIALADGLSRPAEDLIREADAAMYRAKDGGRGRYEIFDEVMRDNATERLRLDHDLRRALDGEDELIVHYQPIVSVPSGEVIGFEALVRWQHPERGLVLPGEFIAVAEESGVIEAIGDHVLRLACEQAASWIAALDRRPLSMSVNLSPRQVAEPQLAKRVAAILEQTSLHPDRLQLEITENALIEESERTALNLRELKALGVSLVLDDFGTGYSSLAYLRRFPIDAIKIDRRFIAGISRATDDTTIVEAILRMAVGLRLAVIAEGVETAEQAAILHNMGCRRGQGFLWARPMAPAAATAFLELASAARA